MTGLYTSEHSQQSRSSTDCGYYSTFGCHLATSSPLRRRHHLRVQENRKIQRFLTGEALSTFSIY